MSIPLPFTEASAREAFGKYLAKRFDVTGPTSGSDVLIKCGGRETACHKLVLSLQSDWFQRACFGHFKKTDSPSITLHGESEKVIYELLRYCYAFSYEVPDGTEDDLMFHGDMFAAAEKYEVKKLDALAAQEFFEAAKTTRQGALITAITAAYAKTADPNRILRGKIISLVLIRAGTNKRLRYESAAFRKLLVDVPPFGADVLRAMANHTLG